MNNILSVFVLNRNNSDNVLSIYADLKKQTFQDFHVNIIDDNSDRNELQKLLDIKAENFFVYSYPAPFKFGNDNNYSMGLRIAAENGSKYSYMLQDDMKINSLDLLEKLVEHMESNPQCGAACPTLYNGNGEMTWGPGIKKVRMGKTYNINETFILRIRLIKEMNYIPEKLIYYGHEYYINNWLKLHGFTTAPVAGVSVTHYGGGTSTSHWDEKYYYRPRTTILIMKLFNKNDSLIEKVRYFRSECWEGKSKLKEYMKSGDFINFIKLAFIFAKGTLAGLLIPIKLTRN